MGIIAQNLPIVKWFYRIFYFQTEGDEFSEQTKYFEIRIDFVLNKFETISYKNIDIENV